MKTSKQLSFNALNSNFAGVNSKSQEWELDIENLVETIKDEIQLGMTSDERCQSYFQTRRAKTHSIVWNAFSTVAQRCLDDMLFPNREKYYVSSEHLKAWLKSYGYDYKDCFVELIQEIDEFRDGLIKEYKEFQKSQKQSA